MKKLGYGKGYKYAHDFPDAKVNRNIFRTDKEASASTIPQIEGFEKTIKERMEEFEKDRE